VRVGVDELICRRPDCCSRPPSVAVSFVRGGRWGQLPLFGVESGPSRNMVRIPPGQCGFRNGTSCDGAVVMLTGRAGARISSVVASGARLPSMFTDGSTAAGVARLPVTLPRVFRGDRAVASRRGALSPK